MIIEAIIPPQAAMIVDIETDSRLRTLQDVRHTIKRNGGTITPTAYLFKRKGRVVLEADERKLCPDDVLDEVIEAGAEDVEMDYAGNFVVWTEPADTVAAARSLSSALKAKVASSDIIWDPNEDTMVPMTKEEDFDALNKIVDALQEDSTIQGIYVNVTNGGIPEEKWAELAEKIPV
jgi:transcriptional/translational regulatory protein YebC/TACO1